MTKKLFVCLDGTEVSPEEMVQRLAKRVRELETQVTAQKYTIENLINTVSTLQNV